MNEYQIVAHKMGAKDGWGVNIYDVGSDQWLIVAWFKTREEANAYIQKEKVKQEVISRNTDNQADDDIPF